MLILNEKVCHLFNANEMDNLNLWEINISILSQGIEIILWYLVSDNSCALNNVLSIRNIFIFRKKGAGNKSIMGIQYAHFPGINIIFQSFWQNSNRDFFRQLGFFAGNLCDENSIVIM